MMLVFLKLVGTDGRTVEASAYAKHAGQLLPPGHWRVVHTDGREELMGVEEMPAHWQEQFRRSGEFGKNLD